MAATLESQAHGKANNSLPADTSFARRALDIISRPQVQLRAVLYLTLLVYLPSVLFDFVYDDVELIPFNPWMVSWKGLGAIWTHAFWAFSDFPRAADYYRPLVMTTLWIIRHVAGSAPGWFHIVAIAIHIIAVYLTYRLALALSGDSALAALSAAIFGLHPTKLESVAWISGISDSLCLVFMLACFLTYLKWRSDGSRGLVPTSSVIFLLLGMLSKEMAVVTPVLIATYEVLTRGGKIFDRLRSTAIALSPYALVLALVFGVRSYAMRSSVAVKGVEIYHLYSIYAAPRSVFWYLEKQLIPSPLSLHYPLLSITRFSFVQVVVPYVVLLLASAFLLWRVRSSVLARTLLAWFVLTIAPVVVYGALLQLHDRHMYAPSVATSIALAYLIVAVWSRARFAARSRVACVLLICMVLTANTLYEMQFWGDNVTLFTRAVRVGYDRTEAYSALSAAYSGMSQYDEAEEVAKAWVRNTGDGAGGWASVGQARLAHKDSAGAREALELSVKSAKTPAGRVRAAASLATIAEKENNYTEAEYWHSMAVSGEPDVPVLHYNYANVLRHMGKTAEADRELKLYKSLRERQGI